MTGHSRGSRRSQPGRRRASSAEDWNPPEAAISRKTFEAQYPKQTATAAALEIEELASSDRDRCPARTAPLRKPATRPRRWRLGVGTDSGVWRT